MFCLQLKQVKQAIKQCNSKDQLDELLSLRDSLVELIALTSESCTSKQTVQTQFDEEYALFKVRISSFQTTRLLF